MKQPDYCTEFNPWFPIEYSQSLTYVFNNVDVSYEARGVKIQK